MLVLDASAVAELLLGRPPRMPSTSMLRTWWTSKC
jgi:hypothetical protein